MKSTFLGLLGVLSFLAFNSAGAEAPLLKVGDPAPKLQTGKWIQGEPVSKFERDKVYMVEFWATWCGPCRTSIPHVNELHNKFKDKGFVVIGQDVWEQDESKVEPFVKQMGDKMTYRVALDDKNGSERGKMAETWMQAAGRNGIPAAFLVNKEGKIAWIGHPMSLKEDLLVKILDGSFDLKAAAADYALRQKTEGQQKELWESFQKAASAKDWEKASAALDELEKIMPADDKPNIQMNRFQLSIAKEDAAGAYQIARMTAENKDAHPVMLNQMAWIIATHKSAHPRNLDLAEKLARQAAEKTKEEESAVLDTLARVLALKGDFKSAIRYQEKAVASSRGDRNSNLKTVLESYKKGEIPK